MKITKIYTPETGKTSWTFDQWYRKAIYWIGLVSFWYLALSFTVGFIYGVISALVE